MLAALLDTCVLWPSLQRDFLLSLAVEGMYRPLWSSAILEELRFHERAKLVTRGLDPEEAQRRADFLIETMSKEFDDAEVEGWEALEGSYGLPDPDDEHVVAAAVLGSAGAIVTLNTTDFPRERVPRHIDVIAPSRFAANTLELDPRRGLEAVTAIVSRSGRKGPVLTDEEVLDRLVERYAMQEVVAILRAAR